MTTDEILASHKIDNAADAALVRLAAAAASMDEPPDVLLRRAGLSHPNDQLVARAIIDAVRVDRPRPPSRGTMLAGWGVALAAVIASAVFATMWNRSESALSATTNELEVQRTALAQARGDFDAKVETMTQEFARQLATTQDSTKAAFGRNEEVLRSHLTEFAQTLQRNMDQIAALSSENARLTQEVARLRESQPAERALSP